MIFIGLSHSSSAMTHRECTFSCPPLVPSNCWLVVSLCLHHSSQQGKGMSTYIHQQLPYQPFQSANCTRTAAVASEPTHAVIILFFNQEQELSPSNHK